MKATLEQIQTKITIVSSLEKVFPDCQEYQELNQLEGFPGERLHFQIVTALGPARQEIEFEASGPLADHLQCYEVVYVPCFTPASEDDPNILRNEPGLFPAPLVKKNRRTALRNITSAFWITLTLPPQFTPGEYQLPIRLNFSTPHRKEIVTAEFKLPVTVWSSPLPPQKLTCEMWFHGDCLLNYYKVKCWSPAFWKLLKNYFEDMILHGVNMLLTPLWTLSLDIQPGYYRPTVQLLSIKKEGETYHFDFRRLSRWIRLARSVGFKKFSFSHLFTQWGLENTPKIMVSVNGVEQRLFGWDVPSDSPEYASFLKQLFAALLPYLRRQGLTPEDAYFHLSDEPNDSQFPIYQRCSRLVHSFLGEYRTFDALSHTVFFEQGSVDCPVVRETHFEDFLHLDIPERWIYYCGEWEDNVPNRKMGMASIRNRILGILLYLYQIDGFLEWGYNFWFSERSLLQDLDPWNVADIASIYSTDGGGYAVYPGKDGHPVSTVYFEVFSEAMQDLRVLQMVEAKLGRDQVLALLQEGLETPLTLHNWPSNPQWLFQLRRRLAKACESPSLKTK